MEALPIAATPSEDSRSYWLVNSLTSPHLRWLLLAVLYVIVQPPETGLGIDLCTLHRETGAPCPGCGMTRSGANLVRGHVVRAFQFHPFGLVLIPILFALAGLSLLPAAWRAALARRLSRRQRLIRVLYMGFIGAFLLFGLVRFVLVLANVIEWQG